MGKIEAKTSVRTCNFSYSGNMALYSTDSTMGNPSEIFIIDVRTVDSSFSENDPILRIPLTNAPKATSMVWGNLDEVVISGHDNGDLAQWDLRWEWHCRNLECLKLNPVYYLHRTGKKNNLVSEHAKSINDMQLSKDGALLITASKDCTAKLFNAETLECLKTYKTERPVNSAAISPIMDHVWSFSF